jgi:hypothetical protein
MTQNGKKKIRGYETSIQDVDGHNQYLLFNSLRVPMTHTADTQEKEKTTPKKDNDGWKTSLNEIFWQYRKLFFGDTLTHARHTKKRRRNTEQTAQQMKNASTSSEYVKAY